MEQHGIIETLEIYCINKGYKFIWQADEFETNIQIGQEHDNSFIVVAELQSLPTFKTKYPSEITYSGLVMVGRKFDTANLNDTHANLDETKKQKYTRRLKILEQKLSEILGEFSCSNDLEITVGSAYQYLYDKTDSDIDFVASMNTTFTQ